MCIVENTAEQFARETAVCRDLFAKKTYDYGTSWRVMRLPSITDQIFIKANRIRGIQENGMHRIADGMRPEFIAMVNYGTMALIQLELGEEDGLDLSPERALQLYDKHLQAATKLMLDKNHDYGEAWRLMRISSITDIILMKIHRLKQIEDNQGKTIVSEGVEGNYMDIVNYSLFCLIKLESQSEEQ